MSHLHELMISQLLNDGWQELATQMSSSLNIGLPCLPTDRLMKLVTLGLEKENEQEQNVSEQMLGTGLDMEFEKIFNNDPVKPRVVYSALHKAATRSGAFSGDGQFCATGSADKSIKILDVDKWVSFNQEL